MSTFNPGSCHSDQFIHEGEIEASLDYAFAHEHDTALIDDILAKAREGAGLSHREAAVLLACSDPQKNDEIFALAKEIKERCYGNRIVLFAPLYLSNYCINGCTYCPYRGANRSIKRQKLSQAEIAEEVKALQCQGHKRLAIEAGEDPKHSPIEYILDSIGTIYSCHFGHGSIRRVNVNIAATTVDEYRMLHEAEIGTYILFQETYNQAKYRKLHPTGPKSDYHWHTEAMDRAMCGGIEDVGLGVLYGLDNYLYEFVATLMHAEHLEASFGVGPHTISVPRIRPAMNSDPSIYDNGVPDEVFTKLVACLRIAVPYTGIIVSTRESEAMRSKLLQVGVSQVSGGSRTSVGGYANEEYDESTAQFEIDDRRSLDEVVAWLISQDHLPSFCTACYRMGRVGDSFMKHAKHHDIHDFCQPNALITLHEYLIDYASEETRRLGSELIAASLPKITDKRLFNITQDFLGRLNEGERDFYL